MQSFNRSFSYDPLNRLSSMSAPSDPSGCTGLAWSYDAWGNRTAQSVTGGACYPSSLAYNASNQISGLCSGTCYDAAGDVINDGIHAYTYDAEHRIAQVDGGSTASYVYDAVGHRVQKTAGGATTAYLYDLSDQVVSELAGSSMAWSKSYVELSGQRAEYVGGTGGSTYFAFTDHLGSTRLVTNMSGCVVDNLDYQPYGELYSYSPQCTTQDTTHKFTGQERDSETGNDNFQARYYGSRLGRFLSPDPLGNSVADPSNPQTWNQYAYVTNNPLLYTDPTGTAPYGGECDYSPLIDEGSCGNLDGVWNGGSPAATPDPPTISSYLSGAYNVLKAIGNFFSSAWNSGDDYVPPPDDGSWFVQIQPLQIQLKGTPQTPTTPVCTAAKYGNARQFVNANSSAGSQIAQKLSTTLGNILGLAGFESGWGTGPLISAGTNNYFSLQAGPAFSTGATGTTKLGANTFENYPSFLASGMALANSYIGARVNGITNPVAFAQALNAGQKYNSKQPSYNKTLVNTIAIANGALKCG